MRVAITSPNQPPMFFTMLLVSSTARSATASQMTVVSAASLVMLPWIEPTIVSVAFFTRNGVASASTAVSTLAIITIT